MTYYSLALICFVLIFPQNVFACQIGWQSEKELMQAATLVVRAEVVSAKQLASSFRADTYQYELRVASVKQGQVKNKKLTVTFEELKSHLRGKERICPIKIGSGIEQELKPEASYEIYIRSVERLEILLAKEIP